MKNKTTLILQKILPHMKMVQKMKKWDINHHLILQDIPL